MNIRDMLSESISRIITTELSKDDIVISSYDMDESNDNAYIRKNINDIWNLLQEAYKDDFRGFGSRNDLKRKASLVRLATYNNELIAVSTYNTYLGGNKCVGIGATRKDKFLHSLGKISVENILRTDLELPENWFWFEASGAIEKICDGFNAIKIPAEYVHLFIKKSFVILDDYHYITKIGGIEEQKCIFGFKDQKTYNIVMNKIFNDYNNMIESDEENKEISETVKYRLYDSEEEQVKSILDRFISMYYDDHIFYAPQHLIDKLNIYIKKMETIIKENKSKNIRNLKICYNDARSVQKKMKVLKLHKGLYG